MRKLFALCLLSAGGAFVLSGCALTDYTNGAAQVEQLALNHTSHAAAGCTDGIANGPFRDINGSNSQQSIERLADDVLQRCLTFPNGQSNATFGPPGGVPLACIGAVTGGASSLEAREWERFVGSYTFFGEAQVLYPSQPGFQGFWSIGGNKALDSDQDGDGMRDVRINTWFCPITQFGGFTCPTGQANGEGTYGAPEITLLGHHFNNDLPACTAPMNIETVAIDSNPAVAFGPNIQALTANRNTIGYSTFWGIIGRAYEGKLMFAPIKPSAGLAEFFSGTPIRINGDSIGLTGMSVTASASVRPDGMMNLGIVGASYNDSSITLSTPLTVAVSHNFKLYQFDAAGQTRQLRELAAWAISQQLPVFDGVQLGGFLPELGRQVQPIALQISREGTARIASGSGINPGDQGRGR